MKQAEVGLNITQSHLLAHRKSYVDIICAIHVKSWPKAKLDQFEVGSNIAQIACFSQIGSHMWSLYVPIQPIHVKSC